MAKGRKCQGRRAAIRSLKAHSLLGLANTDDKHFPTELNGKDASTNTSLDTRAFHRAFELHTTRSSDDRFGDLLFGLVSLDDDGANARDELFREFETGCEQVGDDDRFTAGCASRK